MSEKINTGQAKLLSTVINRGLCTGCGACTQLCPYMKNHKGKTVALFSCDREEGRCFMHCPQTDVDYDLLSKGMFGTPCDKSPLGTYISIKASKSGSWFEKSRCQNGGTVSALLAYALKKKIIDGAVVTDSNNMIPVPKIVTDIEGILSAASTKYMAAPTVSKVNEALNKGFQKLGVVGTPCQMTAIAKIKSNSLGKEDFKNPTELLIGLFCTWAVDTRRFVKLVSEKTNISSVTGMEIPPPPAEVFILKTTGGNIEIPLDSIRQIIPDGCALCPDMTCQFADLSVGAFEGRPGWNTLIIRTQKGNDIVNKAAKEGYLILDDFPEENLAHLTAGAGNKKERGKAKQKKLNSEPAAHSISR